MPPPTIWLRAVFVFTGRKNGKLGRERERRHVWQTDESSRFIYRLCNPFLSTISLTEIFPLSSAGPRPRDPVTDPPFSEQSNATGIRRIINENSFQRQSTSSPL